MWPHEYYIHEDMHDKQEAINCDNANCNWIGGLRGGEMTHIAERKRGSLVEETGKGKDAA